MSLELPTSASRPFGDPQQRLEYMIDMIRQLQSMSATHYPTVSRHLGVAQEEAERLRNLSR